MRPKEEGGSIYGCSQAAKLLHPPEFIDVNGLTTAYRRKGSGEPVLFLHGAGSTRMWLPMYERFSQSVDFIAPEHPGFGETERPDWLQNFDDLVIHYDQLLAEPENPPTASIQGMDYVPDLRTIHLSEMIDASLYEGVTRSLMEEE